MSPKQPFADFIPAQWLGTCFPRHTERNGVKQVVAIMLETPTGRLRLLLDETTASHVRHACTYYGEDQSEHAKAIPLNGPDIASLYNRRASRLKDAEGDAET